MVDESVWQLASVNMETGGFHTSVHTIVMYTGSLCQCIDLFNVFIGDPGQIFRPPEYSHCSTAAKIIIS